MVEEICIYILPAVYLLIILAHLFKFKKEKIRYNSWLFAFMFMFPILIYWGMVNEAFNGMVSNSTLDRLNILGGIASIVPFLYVFSWIMLSPKEDTKEKNVARNNKDKVSDGDRFFVAAPIAMIFMLVSGEVLMDPKSKINVSLTELIGSQGWIYYVSTVNKVYAGPVKYTIHYQSDYGFRDTDSFGSGIKSHSPHVCPFKVGDKALWRRGYGMKGASSKVMNYNNANKPELAKKIEQYNTPILVIDHKDIHYNSVTKPSEYGINILYKAVVEQADSGRLCLSFRDIHNNEKSIMYTPAHQERFMPDTFLLFNNEVSAPNFVVCAQQINTRENWAKVSDYGYIFGFDIYSKAEIEDKFEEVRKYVDNLRETGN